MKISNLMEQERISSQHNRKRYCNVKRREMHIEKCDVFPAKENPLLIELENLLLGRTDQIYMNSNK